ncbi:MAG: hypothetical protein JW797_16110 [Bradymonadales bacterium]|nr:hypothetical protein [Bradymonadales bacterium]
MSTVERVGVIPRSLAVNLDLLGHGFTPLHNPASLNQIESAITFVARDQVEQDPQRKQIIPYGVVTREELVFAMERLTGGGERRLWGKVSLGVGGHINPGDSSPDGSIRTAFERELHEELIIRGIQSVFPCGFLNDDSQPVGSVHLGVVYLVKLTPHGCAEVREADALRGGFVACADLDPLQERMESWSAFVLQALRGGLIAL